MKILIVLCVLTAVAIAGEPIQKQGYDLYWKNTLALAPRGSIIQDSLVPNFLKAQDATIIVDENGKPIVGGRVRSVSPDGNKGWLLTIERRIKVTEDGKEVTEWYSIKSELVFDLSAGAKEKK